MIATPLTNPPELTDYHEALARLQMTQLYREQRAKMSAEFQARADRARSMKPRKVRTTWVR